MSDPHLYRSIDGALQYETLTRPDISYSVNKACQFMSAPLDTLWATVRMILRYLSGTISHGIVFSPFVSSQKFSLRAYNDSYWAINPDDRRSTSGSCIFFGYNLIVWNSKKQSLIARSSTKAEYRSLAHRTTELIWIESLLTELQILFHPPTLLCNNLSAVLLFHNPDLHARIKHVEIDIHFV